MPSFSLRKSSIFCGLAPGLVMISMCAMGARLLVKESDIIIALFIEKYRV